ncbi:MAG: ligase, partial [Verrucomicrobiaceae bacterium]|nr:ligase [Verrucomicrobiaceae bacterium]
MPSLVTFPPSMSSPPLIEVTHSQGAIYLPEMDFWLDPHHGADFAFISHAHADHVAKHQFTLCSPLTHRLMQARYSAGKGEVVTLEFDEPYNWKGHTLRLLPAGHILGSAMIHITRESDGGTLLYTGDYKLRQGLTARRAELLQADVLIMETTFGLPQYAFPPIHEIVASMLKFVRETLDEHGIPVLLGYSLGKAQEILFALKEAGAPIMLHSSVMKLMEVCAAEVPDLPAYREFDSKEAAGHVLIFPPMGTKSIAIRKLKVARTAMLS